MNNDSLKQLISTQVPDAVFEEGGEFLSAVVDSGKIHALAQYLRENGYDYLSCLSAVDWKTHFFIVYHLVSRGDKHTFVLKAKIIDHVNPEVHTVSDIWKGALMHEREAYDLMGIKFTKHPDLRRLFLEDGWGFPLRKDYQDDSTIVSL